jgi:hypothetical protein
MVVSGCLARKDGKWMGISTRKAGLTSKYERVRVKKNKALLTNTVGHYRADNCSWIGRDRIGVVSRDFRQVDVEVAGELEVWKLCSAVWGLSQCWCALGSTVTQQGLNQQQSSRNERIQQNNNNAARNLIFKSVPIW